MPSALGCSDHRHGPLSISEAKGTEAWGASIQGSEVEGMETGLEGALQRLRRERCRRSWAFSAQITRSLLQIYY